MQKNNGSENTLYHNSYYSCLAIFCPHRSKNQKAFMFSIEAIVNVLVSKGIVNKEELIEEIQRLNQEYETKKN